MPHSELGSLAASDFVDGSVILVGSNSNNFNLNSAQSVNNTSQVGGMNPSGVVNMMPVNFQHHQHTYTAPTNQFMHRYNYNPNLLFDNFQNMFEKNALAGFNFSENDTDTNTCDRIFGERNHLNDEELHLDELSRIKLEDIDDLNNINNQSNSSVQNIRLVEMFSHIHS